MSLLDGLDLELDSDVKAKIDEHINRAHVTKLNELKLDFKGKMDALDSKKKDLEEKLKSFDGFDPEKISDLLKHQSTSDSERKAFEEEMKKKFKEKEEQLAAKEADLKKLDIESKIRYNLDQYEAKKEGLAFAEGAKSFALRILQERRREENGETYYVKPDQKPFVTENGYGSESEYLSSVLSKEMSFLFQQPSGSGAPGSRQAPGSASILSRKDFSALDPREQMKFIQEGGRVS